MDEFKQVDENYRHKIWMIKFNMKKKLTKQMF